LTEGTFLAEVGEFNYSVLNQMSLIPKKNVLVFCSKLIRLKKKKKLSRKIFFNSSIFSLRKLNLKMKFSTTKTVVPFSSLSIFSSALIKIEREEKGTTVFVEFSNLVFSK
jgi:hypothetical protein